jgi:hypothetical protein
MSWNAMDELKSHWHELGEEVELHGEEGLWTIFGHEACAQFHMAIANDQHGSIKMFVNKKDVTELSEKEATEVRYYLGLHHSDGLTNYDVFMAKTGNKDFVQTTTQFIIG